jgi:tetraprenyl-beta-curcumene synthase
MALRAVLALATANLRYWPTVAPGVRAQLHRWTQRARAIPDPLLRALAMDKLHAEHFNAEVAATLATLAPRAHRKQAVEAIVALEVLYDYLDGLSEQPVDNQLVAGARLYAAFTGAIDPRSRQHTDFYGLHDRGDDGGYMQELSTTVANALDRLPSSGAIAETAALSLARCAEGQIRVHAAPRIGRAQLEKWAQADGGDIALGWQEYVAGAVASVLAVHALIAAAANEGFTEQQAAATDLAYLSICALSTMLDSLIDYERDRTAGEVWYMRDYEDRELLADRLVEVAHDAVTKVRVLPHSAHHLMTLVGVVAYYTSAPQAKGELVRRPIDRLHRELRPLITPTFAVMRCWRLAKCVRVPLARSLASRGQTRNE